MRHDGGEAGEASAWPPAQAEPITLKGTGQCSRGSGCRGGPELSDCGSLETRRRPAMVSSAILATGNIMDLRNHRTPASRRIRHCRFASKAPTCAPVSKMSLDSSCPGPGNRLSIRSVAFLVVMFAQCDPALRGRPHGLGVRLLSRLSRRTGPNSDTRPWRQERRRGARYARPRRIRSPLLPAHLSKHEGHWHTVGVHHLP